MANIKNAMVSIAMVWIECPDCHEPITCPENNYSSDWPIYEVPNQGKSRLVDCIYCNKQYVLKGFNPGKKL